MAYDYNRVQNFKTGIFVLVGLVVTIASIIILGGDKSFFTSHQQLKVKFKQVQGLNIGSVVSLSGIKIGNVKTIELTDDEQVLVTLNINSDYFNRIKADSTASIKTQGALGDKYIFIKPGSPDVDTIKSESLITASGDGDIFDMLYEKGPKIDNITQIVNELKNLLSNINKDDNSAKLIESLLKTSQKAEKLIQKSEKLVSDARGESNKELAQTITRLNNILGKLDRGEGTLGALINDPSVHERLSTILGKAPRNSYLKPLIRATIKTKDKKK